MADGEPAQPGDGPDIVDELSELVSRRFAGVDRSSLADCRIGLFDSGTGGLTDVGQILTADRFTRGESG